MPCYAMRRSRNAAAGVELEIETESCFDDIAMTEQRQEIMIGREFMSFCWQTLRRDTFGPGASFD